MRVHERELLSAELNKDHELWLRRQKSGKLKTKAKDIGHAGIETEAFKHHHDDEGSGHINISDLVKKQIELEEMQKGSSAAAHKKWMQRQERGALSTKADNLGHFASGTVSRLYLKCTCSECCSPPKTYSLYHRKQVLITMMQKMLTIWEKVNICIT